MEPKASSGLISVLPRIFTIVEETKDALAKDNMNTFSILFAQDVSRYLERDYKQMRTYQTEWFAEQNMIRQDLSVTSSSSDETDSDSQVEHIVPEFSRGFPKFLAPSPVNHIALIDLSKDLNVKERSNEPSKIVASKLKKQIQTRRSHNRRKWKQCLYCKVAFNELKELSKHYWEAHRQVYPARPI